MVLPEDLCARLADLAAADSRTVSNMARVLIQQGIERWEQAGGSGGPAPSPSRLAPSADQMRRQLELQQGQSPRRLRGAPRRLRLFRPR